MKIRKYLESDKSACRKICCESSFGLSEDIDLKSLFIADCEYYLDNAIESSFVAVNDYDEAVGYVLCARDYKSYMTEFKKSYWKKILLAPDILLRKVTEGLLYRKYSGEYPAHLRIGVLPGGQRMGVGTALIGALSEYLRGEGVPGVMAVCDSHNNKGMSFYRKSGFIEKKKFLGYVAFTLDLTK